MRHGIVSSTPLAVQPSFGLRSSGRGSLLMSQARSPPVDSPIGIREKTTITSCNRRRRARSLRRLSPWRRTRRHAVNEYMRAFFRVPECLLRGKKLKLLWNARNLSIRIPRRRYGPRDPIARCVPPSACDLPRVTRTSVLLRPCEVHASGSA